MKKIVFILLFVGALENTFAQSGTLLPSGFLIPRVSSLATCNTASQGTIVYQTTDNKMYFCNSTSWIDITSGSFSIPYSNTSNSVFTSLTLTNSGPGNVAQLNAVGTGNALFTEGKLKLTNIGEGANKVLTSDAVGQATWQDPPTFSLPYLNTTNSTSSLMNITNTGTGKVINAIINNAANNTYSISASTNGTGSAAYFTTTNANGNALITNGALTFMGIGQGNGKVLTSDASGNATWKNQTDVAFSAYSTSNPQAEQNNFCITHSSTFYTIHYASESFDIGSDFDSSNDIFTAPYNGIYHFDAFIKAFVDADLGSGAYYTLSFWVNNSINYAQAYAGANYHSSVSLSADIYLNAGNTVNTKAFYANFPGGYNYLCLRNDASDGRFSGHLVTRYP